jgi:hypothetical protein
MTASLAFLAAMVAFFVAMIAVDRLFGKSSGEKAKRTCSANLADTEQNERQAFKHQQFSTAKSEMAYHNHCVLNSLGGSPRSAIPFPWTLSFPLDPAVLETGPVSRCYFDIHRCAGARDRRNCFGRGT